MGLEEAFAIVDLPMSLPGGFFFWGWVDGRMDVM
jgi:hypothetical protein